MSKAENVKTRLKIAVLAVAAYGVIVNTALLFALLTPVYILSGPISGYIGIVSYRITAFNKVYLSPALDMASFLSIIILTASTLNIASGLVTTYSTLKHGKPKLLVLETLMASSLILLISLGTLTAIKRILAHEITYLTRNFSYDSSAGRVLIESVNFHQTPSFYILQGLTYAIVTIPYVIAAVVLYLRVILKK